jgi:hypothetical protein
MTWDKPKNAKQWALLFVPAGICVLATILGGLVDPREGDWMGWAIVGLLIASAVSVGLSIWLARGNASWGDQFACALVCFLILMAVNCAVSFAGCAVGATMLPGMTFH